MKDRDRIDELDANRALPHGEWTALLSAWHDADTREYARAMAQKTAIAHFGNQIYIRGIVEFSNFCRNDCLYCGIRRSNPNITRYRLTPEALMACCGAGYAYGFRTFVLQSGEDPFFTVDRMEEIVRELKRRHPDCAVTLSVGELSREDYRKLFDAGADRYLLRHETADETHYARLHPARQSWANRMRCLRDLKDIGYQAGCGMMIDSPFQTPDCLTRDMEFMTEFRPEMIGLGPFIPHCDTPFRDFSAGTFEHTLFMLSLCRILLPDVLLPATTALGVIHPRGRELGILAGANVIMPNLSPPDARKNYLLYNHKNSADAECGHIQAIQKRLDSIGYTVKVTRGDYGENLC